jgi:hypothetical protein
MFQGSHSFARLPLRWKNRGGISAALRYLVRRRAGCVAAVRGRSRRYALPEAYVLAVATALQVERDVIERIVVSEYSRFARLHGKGALATTRRNAIHLRDSGTRFIADPEFVLHEYYHVVHQWNTGALTHARYLWESIRKGYWNNRFEVEARKFAREKRAEFQRCAARREA